MLTKIQIQNYQSHQNTVLDLGPGVNVIVGPSNAGKSACVRAMIWPITNRPLGTGFIRIGQNEADVLLEETRANGQKVSVERIRGKTRNEYILNGDSEHPFTAFGSNPPEDVLTSLNLRDVNIQTQFAPYFLVFDSPGLVGTAIRQVTGMEKIDQVCDVIASRIRNISGRTKDREVDLAASQEKLDVLSKIDLDRMESLINQAEVLEKRRSDLEKTRQRITSLVSQLSSVQNSKVSLPEERLKQISALVSGNTSDLLKLQTTSKTLGTLISGLRSSCLNRVVLPADVDQVLGRRESLVAQYNSLCTKLQTIYKAVEALASCAVERQRAAEELREVEEDRAQMMSQLTTCPWCNSSLTDLTRGHLLEHSR